MPRAAGSGAGQHERQRQRRNPAAGGIDNKEITRDGVFLGSPGVKNTNQFVDKITIMPGRDFGRKDEAWFLLHKIASMVEPIMREHGFRVRHLAEFDRPELLGMNMNRGAKVWLRLRHNGAARRNEFLPLGSLLGTMLHELTHNKIGPHNDAFNRYWRGMVADLEARMAKGFTGSGFYSTGKRLGVTPGDKNGSRMGVGRVEAESAFNGTGRRLGGSGSTGSNSDTRVKPLRNNRKQMKNLILAALEKRLVFPENKSDDSETGEDEDEEKDKEKGNSDGLRDDDLRVLETRIKPGAYATLKIEMADHGDDDVEITGTSNAPEETRARFEKIASAEAAVKKERLDIVDLTGDDDD
ncbi:uncharacterized protein SAPINGB_P001277 [Magnusiomyces paraingens]|uniref:WLM domain-containing protein n=1 Tax=Magnusiomyces paraingens TaxID=2606893 RepID=A0A5E8B5G7_9ASCO|nr:uncharacterized protein SAPINGB_P001277 [Saprochaete ingens]VVT46566.1 unnamed protein product [Saprochaete ingens]